MQAEKRQQSWKVNIQARAKNFNFKLKATKILPTGKLHRFSLLLRLHNFILKFQLKSGSTVSISTERKRTLKSKFLSLLKKLRLRPSKKTLTIQHPDVRSVLNRLKQYGIKVLIIFTSQAGFWMILIVGTAASWAALYLGKGYVSEFAWSWRAWSHAAYSGCWYAACQVIFALAKILFPHIFKLKEKWF